LVSTSSERRHSRHRCHSLEKCDVSGMTVTRPYL
jgi:hypothetical protein